MIEKFKLSFFIFALQITLSLFIIIDFLKKINLDKFRISLVFSVKSIQPFIIRLNTSYKL